MNTLGTSFRLPRRSTEVVSGEQRYSAFRFRTARPLQHSSRP